MCVCVRALTDIGVSDLCELLPGQPVSSRQLLDDLPDSVTRETQVGGLEQLVEIVFADEAVVVHVWTRGQRSEQPRGRVPSVFLPILAKASRSSSSSSGVMRVVAAMLETCQSVRSSAKPRRRRLLQPNPLNP